MILVPAVFDIRYFPGPSFGMRFGTRKRHRDSPSLAAKRKSRNPSGCEIQMETAGDVFDPVSD